MPDNHLMSGTSVESPLHLLVPFAAASAPECQALLPGLHLSNLRALWSCLTEQAADRGEDHSLTPPHERARARWLGLPVADGAIAWAAVHSQQPTRPQAFFSLCHYQVGLDQVIVLPATGLALEAAESRALFDAFAPLCAEDGLCLEWESATEWRASGEAFRHLVCASLDRVSGRHAIDWLPRAGQGGSDAATRLVQRLQSEAQMLFYNHPVHDARVARGLLPINGFWVHGAGALETSRGGDADREHRAAAADGQPTTRPSDGLLDGALVGQTGLCIPDTLRQAALRSDWAAWQAAWQALDTHQLADLLAAAQRNEPVRLTLCGERNARTWTTTPTNALRRWARSIKNRWTADPVVEILKDL